MAPIKRSRDLGNSAFVRRYSDLQAGKRHKLRPQDPEIIVDGQRLNNYLDSLEGLSGQ